MTSEDTVTKKGKARMLVCASCSPPLSLFIVIVASLLVPRMKARRRSVGRSYAQAQRGAAEGNRLIAAPVWYARVLRALASRSMLSPNGIREGPIMHN